MRVNRIKQVVAIVAGVIALVLGLVTIRNAGGAVLRASSGADPAAAFNAAPTAPAALLAVITWEPDSQRDGRVLDSVARGEITDAYAQAWAALDRAGRGDRTAPLDTYLAAGVRARATELLATRTTMVTTRHLSHVLRLTFYSDDGSVVAFEVPAMSVERTVGEGRDRTVFASTEELRVVMVLEDGNWRVHLLERVGETLIEP